MSAKDMERAEAQARAQLNSILEDMKELYGFEEQDEDDEADAKREEILEGGALSAEIRSDWMPVGGDPMGWTYRLLLCWGGPSVQLTGELDEHFQPISAVVQYQDWFTGWADLPMEEEEQEAAVEWASLFYWGE